MDSHLKLLLKIYRYRLRRAAAARRWGAEALAMAPAVLGNAMPKSGSHLLIQILESLTELGPFVNPGFPPVNRAEGNARLQDAEILRQVLNMQSGEIRYGYLHAEEPWLSAVTGAGRATVVVLRDPRDWVVSQVFYATDMHPGHMLHAHYNSLGPLEERINAAIEGVDKPGLRAPSVVERYSHYTGWLDAPGVLCLRFEDLIENRRSKIAEILDYLESFDFRSSIGREPSIDILETRIAPPKSGTFRRGTPGEWRERFTEENCRRFDRVAGELLRRLGYEDA